MPILFVFLSNRNVICNFNPRRRVLIALFAANKSRYADQQSSWNKIKLVPIKTLSLPERRSGSPRLQKVRSDLHNHYLQLGQAERVVSLSRLLFVAFGRSAWLIRLESVSRFKNRFSQVIGTYRWFFQAKYAEGKQKK